MPFLVDFDISRNILLLLMKKCILFIFDPPHVLLQCLCFAYTYQVHQLVLRLALSVIRLKKITIRLKKGANFYCLNQFTYYGTMRILSNIGSEFSHEMNRNSRLHHGLYSTYIVQSCSLTQANAELFKSNKKIGEILYLLSTQ